MPAAKKTTTKKSTAKMVDASPKLDRTKFGGDARLVRSSRDGFGNIRAMRAPNKRGDSILNIYPGDVINKADPSVETQMGWGELSSSPSAAQNLLAMVRSGWKFCSAEDWDLSDELKIAMTTDAEGRLVTNTSPSHRLCLMYRSAALMDEADRDNQSYSRDIQENKKNNLRQAIDQIGGGSRGWVDENEETGYGSL